MFIVSDFFSSFQIFNESSERIRSTSYIANIIHTYIYIYFADGTTKKEKNL